MGASPPLPRALVRVLGQAGADSTVTGHGHAPAVTMTVTVTEMEGRTRQPGRADSVSEDDSEGDSEPAGPSGAGPRFRPPEDPAPFDFSESPSESYPEPPTGPPS